MATQAAFSCPQCERQYRWKSRLAGRRVRCKCGRTLHVPASRAAATGAAEKSDARASVCPSCGQAISPGATLCVGCGHNLQTGERLETQVGEPSADPGVSVDASRTRLEKRHSRGQERDLSVPAIISLVIPLLFAGLLYFGVLEPEQLSEMFDDMPPEMFPLFGIVMGLVFLYGLDTLVRAMLFRRRCDASAQAHPGDPVMADYPWNHRETTDNALVRAARRLYVTVACVGLAVGWFMVMPLRDLWDDRAAWWLIGGPAAALTLVGVGYAGYAGYLASKRLIYGKTRLRFDRFPFKPGEAVTLHWHCRRIANCRQLAFTLRCIDEVIEIETHMDGRGRESTTEVFHVDQIWAATRQIDAPQSVDPEVGVPLRFELPTDVPGTHLNQRSPCYWELEVEAERPWASVVLRYLVPVYDDTPAEQPAERPTDTASTISKAEAHERI